MTTTIETQNLEITPKMLAEAMVGVRADIAESNARPRPRRGYIPLDHISALSLLHEDKLNATLVYQRVLADEYQTHVPIGNLTAYATAMAMGSNIKQALLAIAYLGNSQNTLDCVVLIGLSGTIFERQALVAFERILRSIDYAAAFTEAQIHFIHPNAVIRELALTIMAERYLPCIHFALPIVKWAMAKFYLPKTQRIPLAKKQVFVSKAAV